MSLSKFNRKSKFSTWLYAITYNFCIDLIRKRKKDITIAYDDFTKVDFEDDAINDSEILEISVLRLQEVLIEMNEEDKSILLMKYQDELSIKEICESINKTESAVKMKILRAKERFLRIYNIKYFDSVS